MKTININDCKKKARKLGVAVHKGMSRKVANEKFLEYTRWADISHKEEYEAWDYLARSCEGLK